MDRYGLSERRVCQLADLHRSVFQYEKRDGGMKRCAVGCVSWPMNGDGSDIGAYISCCSVQASK